MFGDTATVVINAANVVLKKINQDGYSSEYVFRDSVNEFRMKIRHSKESLKPGDTYPIERHNVLISQVIFATATTKEIFRESSCTFRCRPNDTPLDVSLFVRGAFAWPGGVATRPEQLLMWES